MSKLFDTLEQIRRNESAPLSQGKSPPKRKPVTRNGRRKSLLAVVVCALVGIGIYFSWPRLAMVVSHRQAGRFAVRSDREQTATVSPHTAIEKPAQASAVKGKNITPLGESNPAAPTPPAAVAQTQTSTGRPPASTQDFLAMNNKGAEFVKQENYWQGIYYFKQAHEIQPGRIEPLINLGVALADLGLYGPASRYFRMAAQIDSRNPRLLESIAMLKNADLFESTE